MGLFKTLGVALLGGATALAQQAGNSTECLEALASGGCQLRWELQVSSATAKSGTSSGVNSNTTTPSLLAVLDSQYRAPRGPSKAGGEQTLADCFTAHLRFESGYSQSIVATRVQSLAGSGSTVTPLPQPAFEAGAASTVGWSIGRNGQGGIFAELGFGARAAFDDLLPANQIIQNGGSSWIDLSGNNPQNLAGLYEATAHFSISSWNHNQPAQASGSYSNVSNLLRLEAGYQDNSGLQQLIPGSPQIETRIRFVGRLWLSPELPNSSHTKVTLGLEYSGGLNGGPKIVQIFAGTNLNPAKIFSNPANTD
jgi:hypothetical protein